MVAQRPSRRRIISVHGKDASRVAGRVRGGDAGSIGVRELQGRRPIQPAPAGVPSRSDLADDPEQLGARRGDVDRRRPATITSGCCTCRSRFPRRSARTRRRRCSSSTRRESSSRVGAARRRQRVAGARARHLRRRERLRLDRRARRLAAADHAGRQRRHDPEVHDGRKARDADRPQRPEQGQHRHRQRPPGHRRVRRHARRKRSTPPTATATSASSCSTRKPGSSSGCGAHSATRRRPTFAPNAPAPQPQTTPDGPPEFGLAARDQSVERRRRLRRRSHQQPHPDVHDATGNF